MKDRINIEAITANEPMPKSPGRPRKYLPVEIIRRMDPVQRASLNRTMVREFIDRLPDSPASSTVESADSPMGHGSGDGDEAES